jgi:hypothetical protein
MNKFDVLCDQLLAARATNGDPLTCPAAELRRRKEAA